MAEIVMELDCGGRVVTYFKARDGEDFVKKMRKRHKDGWYDFGHVVVDDSAVVGSYVKFHEVH